MMSRLPGLDQMQLGEHQLVQDGSGAGGLLTTIGSQPTGLSTDPVTSALNSYTAAGMAAASNALLSGSGNGKFGYPAVTTGMLYDGLLKNYQTPGAIQEVCLISFLC